MKLLAQRFVSVIAFLCIFTLVAIQIFNLLALAQESAPFEISITPQGEYAVSGQPLTYTVLVTNVSQITLQNALVRVKVPVGTSLVEALNTNPEWYSNNPPPGITREEALWFTPNAIAPGKVIIFQMVVKPLAELAQQQIVYETYSVGVASEGSPEIVATGIPFEIQLFTPTPAPSATATTPIIPTSFSSSTSTSTPEVVVTIVSSPAATSIAEADTTISAAETPSPPVRTSSSGAENSSFISFIIIGLVVLTIVASLIWFLRKK